MDRVSPVIVEYSVESVSNGQYSAVLELCPDGGLNQFICLHIHGCCSFIQDQDAWFA